MNSSEVSNIERPFTLKIQRDNSADVYDNKNNGPPVWSTDIRDILFDCLLLIHGAHLESR